MTETNAENGTAARTAVVAQSDEQGYDFIDLLAVLTNNLRLLVIAPTVAGLVAFGVSYLIPPTYTAITTFLPPQPQTGIASNLLQSLGSLGGAASAAAGLKNPMDQYVGFLKSQTIQDALVEQFSLLDRYDLKFKSDARQVLQKNTRVFAGKDNILSVEFDDKDSSFAADVANAYGVELTRLLGRLAVTEAQQRRLFFSKQLDAAKTGLIKAEQELAATGVSVAALNASPTTALAGTAALRAQVTAQEVRLASMKSYLTSSAPEYRLAQAEISALRNELAKAETTQPSGITKNGGDYIAKYRNFKYQETLFDLFSKQFEIAKIDESREGSTVQIVDKALPPEKKSKPRKLIVVLIAIFLTGFLCLSFVFARSAWRRAMVNGVNAYRFSKLASDLNRQLGRS